MQNYQQRYSSLPRPEGRRRDSEMRPHDNKVDSLIDCIEGAFKKLECSIDVQNSKMRKFENKVAVAVMEKFDRLIEVVTGLAEGMGRLLEQKTAAKPPQQKDKGSNRPRLPSVNDRQSQEKPPKSVRIVECLEKDKNDGPAEKAERKGIAPIQIEQPDNKPIKRPDLSRSTRSIRALPSINVAEIEPVEAPFIPHTSRQSVSIDRNKQIISRYERIPTTPAAKPHPKVEAESLIQIDHNIPAELRTIQIAFEKEYREAIIAEEENELVTRYTGKFYSALTDLSYSNYASGKVSYEDMKIQYSWNIINRCYDLQELFLEKNFELPSSSKMKRALELLKLVDRSSKESLEYLIHKYPQSRGKVADSELYKRIKEMNKSNEIGYDLLVNANVSFSAPSSKADFSKEIKMFLNRLLTETKTQFEGFRRTMEDIFVPHRQGTRMTEVEYLIGTKIRMETREYTTEELETPGLQLKSPEMVRILLKWMQALATTFEQVDKRVVQNRVGFKPVLKGPSINLARKRKEVLADHIRHLKATRRSQLLAALNTNAYEIMMNLFHLVSTGYKGHEFLNEREVVVAKLAQYLSECMEVSLFKHCNGLLQQLNAIKDNYTEDDIEFQIDMISFGVMDLLRCKCIGSKEEILRIYKALEERSDYFEIIRVKNKLSEGTRDILINLKLKNSFLICEVQLALGKSQEEVNDHFCHFLYELQRSSFAVSLEAAYTMVSIDPRIRYFERRRNMISFAGQEQGDSLKLEFDNGQILCSKSHPPIVMAFQKNDRPICCNACSRFFRAYETCLEFLKCPDCMRNICPMCMTHSMNSKDLAMLFARYIPFEVFVKFIGKNISYSGFSGIAEMKKHVKEVLKSFRYVMVNVFDRDTHKIRFVKEVNNMVADTFCTLTDFYQDEVYDSEYNYCVVFGVPETKVVTLEEIRYHQKYHAKLEWYKLEVILKKNNVKKVHAIVRDTPVKEALIIDSVETEEAVACVHKTKALERILDQEGTRREPCVDLSSKALTSIGIIGRLTNKNAVKICNVSENKLEDIQEIATLTGLHELYASDNILTSIRGIQRLGLLMQLNLQNNSLKDGVPRLDLPELRYLDISRNNIFDLSEFAQSNLPNLLQLNISHNAVEILPVFERSKLEMYNFSHNKVSTFNQKLPFPELTHIYGSHNSLDGVLSITFSKKVKVIIINYNRITGKSVRVADTFLAISEAYEFEVLHLQGNSIIQDIPAVKLKNLSSYNLRNNKLTNIDKLSEWEVPRIYDIDFSINSIEVLPRLNLPSLVVFKISNNRIKSIDELTHSNLERLEILDISENLIEGELPPLHFLSLKLLNLEHNAISGIAQLANSRLPKLVTLKLSHNKIHGPMPIVYMEKIKTIELNFNSVTSLDCLKEMQTIPNLQLISVDNNSTKITGYKCLVPKDPLDLVCEFYRQEFKREGRIFDPPRKHCLFQQQFYCQ